MLLRLKVLFRSSLEKLLPPRAGLNGEAFDWDWDDLAFFDARGLSDAAEALRESARWRVGPKGV